MLLGRRFSNFILVCSSKDLDGSYALRNEENKITTQYFEIDQFVCQAITKKEIWCLPMGNFEEGLKAQLVSQKWRSIYKKNYRLVWNELTFKSHISKSDFSSQIQEILLRFATYLRKKSEQILNSISYRFFNIIIKPK